MLGNEVIEQRPLQPRAKAGIEPEAVAAHLHAAFVVDQAQIRAQIHVVFRLPVKGGFFAVDLDHLVVFLAAGHHVLGGQIGQRHHEAVDFVFQSALLLVHRLDLIGHFLEFGEQFARVLALLFQGGDFLAHAVALSLERLVFHKQRAAAGVPFEKFAEVHVVFALFQGFFDIFGIGTDEVQVQHGIPPKKIRPARSTGTTRAPWCHPFSS